MAIQFSIHALEQLVAREVDAAHVLMAVASVKLPKNVGQVHVVVKRLGRRITVGGSSGNLVVAAIDTNRDVICTVMLRDSSQRPYHRTLEAKNVW